jgi:hypothetical protein
MRVSCFSFSQSSRNLLAFIWFCLHCIPRVKRPLVVDGRFMSICEAWTFMATNSNEISMNQRRHLVSLLRNSKGPSWASRIYSMPSLFWYCHVRVTIMTGSISDNWIYWHFDYKFSYWHLSTTLSLFYTLSVHRCTHTLGFSVVTSRLLARDLNTETSTSNHS